MLCLVDDPEPWLPGRRTERGGGAGGKKDTDWNRATEIIFDGARKKELELEFCYRRNSIFCTNFVFLFPSFLSRETL